MQTPRHLIRALLSALMLVVGLMAFPATASAATTADPLPTGCVDVSDTGTLKINCTVTVDAVVATIEIRCNNQTKPRAEGSKIFLDQATSCTIDIKTPVGTVSFGCMGNGPVNAVLNLANLSFQDFTAGQCDITVTSVDGKVVSVDTKGETDTKVSLTTTTIEFTTHGPVTVQIDGVTVSCGSSVTVRTDVTDPTNPKIEVIECRN